MVRSTGLVVFLIAAVCRPLLAQQWARDMFPVKAHNFGVVARGAKTQYEFEVRNPYAVDVHLAGVRTSCGCTSAALSKQTLKTYETAAVVATFNTGAFVGNRRATLTVTIDKPRFAEVRLQVRGRIRGDVEVSPSAFSFGAVDQGATARRSVLVRRFGRTDWKIVETRNSSDFIELQVEPAGQGTHRVTAVLKDNAPVGYFHRQIWLMTNDSGIPHLPVQVEGRVTAPLTVSPSHLFLGAVPPGQKVHRKLVVHAKQPFRILSIEPQDDRFSFEWTDSARKLHLVPMTFSAGADVAKVAETLTVITDLANGASSICRVSAAVVEPVAAN